LYADDGAQALDAAENALLRLKQRAGDKAAVAELFRSMHTFKGNSRVIGLRVVESRAHLAEDLIGLVRDEGVAPDDELIELLLEVTEVLRSMLEETASRRKDVEESATAELVVRVQSKLQRCRESLKEAKSAEAPSAKSASLPPEDMVFKEAVVFDPVDMTSLAADPEYQKIFSDQAEEFVAAICENAGRFADSPEAARAAWKEQTRWLHLAAGQMGFADWADVLGAFLAKGEPTVADAEALLASIEALRRPKDPVAAPDVAGDVSAQVRPFLEVLEGALSELSMCAATMAIGQPADREAVARIAGDMAAAAEHAGFVRLADVASALPQACSSAEEFQRSVFQLYESLLGLDDVGSDGGGEGFRIQAAAVLRSWCADRIFQVLSDLGNSLDGFANKADGAQNCRKTAGLLQWVSYACQHHDLGAATNLAISLADIFGRGEHFGEVTPAVLHIARTFATAMREVLGAVMGGDVPGMAEVEALARQVSEVEFVTDGTASPVSIEARLGLPASFHKVLTPESVRAALTALDARLRFYIVRADPNADEALASTFSSWLASSGATEISNVTVFEGDRAVFDYLIASPLDERSMGKALERMDATGARLRIERALVDSASSHSSPGISDLERVAPPAAAVDPTQDSGDMLEMIGEVVTGEAMLKRALAALSERDLVREVEGIWRGAGTHWRDVQAAVRAHLESWKEEIDRVAALESQLAGGLDRLQEQANASRCRPGAVLLDAVVSHAEALALQCGRDVALSAEGGDISVDGRILVNLQEPIRDLVEFCVSQSITSPESREAIGKKPRARLSVVLAKHGGSIVVTIEDDGVGLDAARIAARTKELGWTDAGGGPDKTGNLDVVSRDRFGAMFAEDGTGRGIDFSKIRSDLRRFGGDLRVARSLAGGAEFKVTVPLTNVVIDGMVVRVGPVIYVVPVDAIQTIVHSEGGEVMRVSADGGRTMLRVGSDDALPVQFLRCDRVVQGNGANQISGRQFISDVAARQTEGSDARRLFVVAGKGSKRVAISVDEIIGQQLVLMRPLQGYLSLIQGATACALLGGGEVGVVLDVAYALAQACGDARPN